MAGTNVVVSSGSASTSTSGIATLATIPIPSSGYWLVTGCLGSFSGAGNVTFTVSGNQSLDLRYSNGLIQGSYASISAVYLTTNATNLYIVAAQSTAVISVNPIWVFITRIG